MLSAGAESHHDTSAAFNAPLTGLVFVLEELQRDFSVGIFTAAFMSAVAADLVTRLATGQTPIFHVTGTEAPPLAAVPAFILLGAACGLLGVLYNRSLLASLYRFQRMRPVPPVMRGAAVGLCIGLMGWFPPSALGDGHRLVEKRLHDTWPPAAIAGHPCPLVRRSGAGTAEEWARSDLMEAARRARPVPSVAATWIPGTSSCSTPTGSEPTAPASQTRPC